MIQIADVSKIYGRGPNCVYALRDASLEINDGESIAIVGRSGSGKTTLLNILGTLAIPSEGGVFYDGKEVSSQSMGWIARARNRYIGFVFQAFHLLPNMTVKQNLFLPLRYSRVSRRSWKERVSWALERVGLHDKEDRLPSELSSGEQQRVAIARAVVTHPKVILADEPTGNLDSETEKQVMSLLLELNEEGTTLVVVTHNNDLTSGFSRLIQMHDGRITRDGLPG